MKQDLQAIVDEYKITVNGVTFWTPYWIGRTWYLPYSLAVTSPESLKPHLQAVYDANPHLFGKNTPAEVKAAAQQIFDTYPYPITNRQQARHILVRNAIGVDCSSFIYYVLDQYLQQLGKGTLEDNLVMTKHELTKNLELPTWQGRVSKEEIDTLGDEIPLGDIKRLFGKDPIHITDVKRLCAPENTTAVTSADELQPGDLLHMTAEHGDHAVMVTEASEDKVIYASSYSNTTGPGGVKVDTMERNGELIPGETVIPTGDIQLNYTLDAMLRLKVLV